MKLPPLKNRLNQIGSRISEEGLIHFDYKVFTLLLLTTLLFLLAIAFKINYSSAAYWNTVISAGEYGQTDFMIGDPKAIRSDEWMVSTPFVLSQYWHDFPTSNENIGAFSDPLLISLPVKHFSSIFRPQNWGFFFLDIERAFSFYWNFKALGLFISFFFLLMLLTKNSFGLSMLGAFWLSFSGFIQWFFSGNLPDLLISFSLITVTLIYILISRKPISILISSLLLVLFGVNFVLFFYPAFQVPLLYLLLFLLIGFLMRGKTFALFKKNYQVRIGILTAALTITSTAIYVFYAEAKPAIDAISATAYPGNRLSLGGDISLIRLFSGFARLPSNELGYPLSWTNASEASSFILLFPIVLLALQRNLLLKARDSLLLFSLSAYSLFICGWMLIGLPPYFAKLSLLSFVPANRALLGLGVGSIILTIVFLSGKTRPADQDPSFSWPTTSICFVAITLFGLLMRRDVGDFFSNRSILMMALSFSLLAFLLLTKKRLLFATLMLVMLVPFYLVNPVSVGLGPLLNSESARAAQAISEQYPAAKWLVYGNNTIADYLKAAGLNVVNGTKYTPDINFFNQLDTVQKDAGIYNRYAHISFLEPEAGSPRLPARLDLLTSDAFSVTIDPCADDLKPLGISHFAFAYPPDKQNLACLSEIGQLGKANIWLFQRRDE